MITFNVALFRAAYPAYADPVRYPDAVLQGRWDLATCYISDTDTCWMSEECRTQALMMMTAHLQALADLVASNSSGGIVTGATVDKVTVSLTPPPLRNQWQWWLNGTPYGAQLHALLASQAVGGRMIGGTYQRSSMRGIGGRNW